MKLGLLPRGRTSLSLCPRGYFAALVWLPMSRKHRCSTVGVGVDTVTGLLRHGPVPSRPSTLRLFRNVLQAPAALVAFPPSLLSRAWRDFPITSTRLNARGERGALSSTPYARPSRRSGKSAARRGSGACVRSGRPARLGIRLTGSATSRPAGGWALTQPARSVRPAGSQPRGSSCRGLARKHDRGEEPDQCDPRQDDHRRA